MRNARSTNYRLALSLLALAAVSCSRADEPKQEPQLPPAAAAPPRADSSPAAETWTVTAVGIGPIRAGMTLDDARAALGSGGGLDARGALNPECGYVTPRGGPAGVQLMVVGGRIARVDIRDSSVVATAAGARVGDSRERVESLYAGRVRVQPHKYSDGRYLVVTPPAPADSGFRLVFETDEHGKVVRYRAGRLPEAEWVEGCS